MYTCWNTMKNARAVNAGSRIDYTLLSKNHATNNINIMNADILPEIHGSDHCPIYLDLSMKLEVDDKVQISSQVAKFEAKSFYKLINNDIMKMFGTKRARTTESSEDRISPTPTIKSFQKHKISSSLNTKVDGFFKRKSTSSNLSKSSSPVNESSLPRSNAEILDSDDDEFLPSIEVEETKDSSPERRDIIQQKLDAIKSDVKLQKDLKKHNTSNSVPLFVDAKDSSDAGLTVEDKAKRDKLRSLLDSNKNKYEKIPLCRHKEKAVIKVSQTKGKNFGKKFFCCNRPLIVSDSKKRVNNGFETNEFSCGFFKWIP